MATCRRHYRSFSLLILAPILLAAGEATAAANSTDPCQVADYKNLCKMAVKGATDPFKAVEASITYSIRKTAHARILARRLGEDPNSDVCKEMYDDAISDLQEALQNLQEGDEGGLNSNLSSAITYYVTCDDGYEESGEASPLSKVNGVLQELVDTCLALVTLIQ